MAAKRKLPPSPLRTGFTHAGISFLAFAVITGGFATFIHLTGDADKAGPQEIVNLFNETPAIHPTLKNRLSDETLTETAALHSETESLSETEPSLGIDDPGQKHEEDADGEPTPLPVLQASASELIGLPKAPITGLWEAGSQGKLPKIASDGRTPLQVYRRPFSNPAGRPTISIVLGGLGLNRGVTQAAIDELPPEVTLSFVPYTRGLQTWVDSARAAGHEVIIEFPMEPYDYPNNDTGPYTLLTTASAPENLRRAEWLLSQATGYFAVTNYQGAKYATDSRAIAPVFDMLKARGLGFIHDGSAPRSVFETVSKGASLPFAQAARVIDSDPSASAIDEHLLHLEAIALQTGHALGTGFAFPITVDQLRDWTTTLDSKGYKLAPASSLLNDHVSLSGSGAEGPAHTGSAQTQGIN